MKKFTREEYFRSLSIHNKFNLGIKDTGDWSLVSDDTPNNSLYCGTMGSGKSVAGAFTVYSYLKSNPRSLVVGLDPFKGMNDYRQINSKRLKILSENASRDYADFIHFAFNEYMLRKAMSRNSIAHSRQQVDIRPSPVLMVMEEAHALAGLVEWEKMHNVDGSLANKLKMVLKDGGNYAINFLLITQSIRLENMPASLMKYIQNKRIFRTSDSAEDKAALDSFIGFSDKIIDPTLPGRCYDEKHEYQFPFLLPSTIKASEIEDQPVVTLSEIPVGTHLNNEFFNKHDKNDFVL